jgi:hypothetical protein
LRLPHCQRNKLPLVFGTQGPASTPNDEESLRTSSNQQVTEHHSKPTAPVNALGSLRSGARAYYHHAADGCEKVICALWQECLAVYVASALHPTAGFPELLLNIPPDLVSGTDARRREAFAQLEGVLNSTNDKVPGGLFMFEGDGSGLPRRRGYYLGLVVARELGKKRTLGELAHVPMSEAEPLIRAEVARQAH